MFITFEGIEGSGKSTIQAMLVQSLEQKGYKVLSTREPGGCPLGLELRALLLDTKNKKLEPRAELFLFMADRAQHVEEIIRPALQAGYFVICDRYIDSTICYQGYGRGLDLNMLKELNEISINGLYPNLTFLLDISPEKGLIRAKTRNITEGIELSEGRFEKEDMPFHHRVRQGFLSQEELEPERFVIIDATMSIEQLFAECLTKLEYKLKDTIKLHLS